MTPTPFPAPSTEIADTFGGIDIYLFDQLQKGRFDARRRILDAGCGDGRNLIYLLRRGFDVYAADRDPRAVHAVAARLVALRPDLSGDHVQPAELDALPWGDGGFDAVICSAVLHFARDEAHFGRMVTELWRVLAPSGLFFARLASSIGIEDQVRWLGDRRAALPDGSTRFLVDAAMLEDWTARLGGQLLDPVKTTVVDGQRSMTTWVASKGS